MRRAFAAKCRLLAAILAFGCSAATAQEAPLGANLDSLLDYARTYNPEYAAMRFEAEAAGERVLPAGALPDPTLRVETMNVTNSGQDAAPIARRKLSPFGRGNHFRVGSRRRDG